MFRSFVAVIVSALCLGSAASAAVITDPVFVRGNQRSFNDFDHLGAFSSAADMVAYRNQFWSRGMSNGHYHSSTMFDGTNFLCIGSGTLRNYGSDLGRMMNDSAVSTQDCSPAIGLDQFFADTDGNIYEVFYEDRDEAGSYTDTIRKFASIADLLANNGTNYHSATYSLNDRFIGVNGKFYRTNTDSPFLGTPTVVGIAEYNSFGDLLADNAAALFGGGTGYAEDLFMAVPRAALGATVPAPGAIAVLGVAGFLGRRRR
jgi:hypothetical protein